MLGNTLETREPRELDCDISLNKFTPVYNNSTPVSALLPTFTPASVSLPSHAHTLSTPKDQMAAYRARFRRNPNHLNTKPPFDVTLAGRRRGFCTCNPEPQTKTENIRTRWIMFDCQRWGSARQCLWCLLQQAYSFEYRRPCRDGWRRDRHHHLLRQRWRRSRCGCDGGARYWGCGCSCGGAMVTYPVGSIAL